jgi:hypothetical protein
MEGGVIMVADETATELDRLGVHESAPGLVALALALAKAIDDSDAPTAIAVAARELRAVLADLRKLAPAHAEGDAVDDLTARRTARLGA